MPGRFRQNEIDELLAESVDEETFAALPGFGEPLPSLDTDAGWWARRKARELREAEAASTHGVQQALAEVWALPTVEQARTAVEELTTRLATKGVVVDAEKLMERWLRTH